MAKTMKPGSNKGLVGTPYQKPVATRKPSR